MHIPRITSLAIVLLALVACGQSEFEPVVAAEENVEPLPAPLPAAGAVTAIAGATGPGTGAAGPTAMATDTVEPVAISMIAPVPGEDAAGGSGSAHGVATIAFADGSLPPLEDNPETGLAAEPGPAAPLPGGPLPVMPQPASVTVPAAPPAAAAASGEREAVAAVTAYYEALRRGDVGRAYAAWSDGGRASGRTPEQFAAGADAVAIASVSVGKPSRVDGAAGGRYVEVPVTVTSRGRDGREVREVGSFVMRTSQVDGASGGWRIASAQLRELQP